MYVGHAPECLVGDFERAGSDGAASDHGPADDGMYAADFMDELEAAAADAETPPSLHASGARVSASTASDPARAAALRFFHDTCAREREQRQRQPFAYVLRDAEEELSYVLEVVEQGFGVAAMDTATQQHTALHVGKGAAEPSFASDPSCLSRFECTSVKRNKDAMVRVCGACFAVHALGSGRMSQAVHCHVCSRPRTTAAGRLLTKAIQRTPAARMVTAGRQRTCARREGATEVERRRSAGRCARCARQAPPFQTGGRCCSAGRRRGKLRR